MHSPMVRAQLKKNPYFCNNFTEYKKETSLNLAKTLQLKWVKLLPRSCNKRKIWIVTLDKNLILYCHGFLREASKFWFN